MGFYALFTRLPDPDLDVPETPHEGGPELTCLVPEDSFGTELDGFTALEHEEVVVGHFL